MKVLITFIFALISVLKNQDLADAYSSCPPNVPIVNCFVAPCQVNTCPRFPSATCYDNYCGGCNADFYLYGKKVNCSDPYPKKLCPKDKPIVNCLVSPCLNAKCDLYPLATCRENYCGGCFADFYLNNKKVSCKKVKTDSKEMSIFIQRLIQLLQRSAKN